MSLEYYLKCRYTKKEIFGDYVIHIKTFFREGSYGNTIKSEKGPFDSALFVDECNLLKDNANKNPDEGTGKIRLGKISINKTRSVATVWLYDICHNPFSFDVPLEEIVAENKAGTGLFN